MTSIRYQVGGALLQDVSSYVTRDSDRQLFEALKAGEFCYVLNSRQMGKSSLMVRTLAQLQESGWKGIILDFSAKDTQSDQPSFWYNGIINQLNNHFKLLDRGDFRTWLKERDFISPVERLGEFIETVLLPGIIEPIVIFVDEIDSTLGLPFTDDFFALIRACYNRRAEKPDYKRLTFALLGVAAPSELIGDTKRTPFNIGTSIDLSGFTLAEAQPLAAGLAEKSENPQAVLEAILHWTGGQPFLSQRLCQLVADANDYITAGSEASFVEGLVRSCLIENWESQDQQSHLKTIRDRVIKNEQKAGYLLELYRQTRQAGSLPVQNRPEEQELQLSGLVVKREGNLQVYNPIYGEVFNELWIDGELAKLRPYAESFRAWVISGKTDKSRLLRGDALKEAEQWAKAKNPSAEDQDFLSESRIQEREEEFAVKKREGELERERQDKEAAEERAKKAEEAKQILAAANDEAKKRLQQAITEGEEKRQQAIDEGQKKLKQITIIGGVILTAALIIAGFFSWKAAEQKTETEKQINLAQEATEKANQEEIKVGSLKNQLESKKTELAGVEKNAVEKQKQADRAKKDAEIADKKTQKAQGDLTKTQAEKEKISEEATRLQKEAIRLENVANQNKESAEKARISANKANDQKEKANEIYNETNETLKSIESLTDRAKNLETQGQFEISNTVLVNASLLTLIEDKELKQIWINAIESYADCSLGTSKSKNECKNNLKKILQRLEEIKKTNKDTIVHQITAFVYFIKGKLDKSENRNSHEKYYKMAYEELKNSQLNQDNKDKKLLTEEVIKNIYNELMKAKKIDILSTDEVAQSFKKYLYDELNSALEKHYLQKANYDTRDIIFSLAKREEDPFLTDESVNTIPCEELNKINEIWSNYKHQKGSNYFGISKQTEMWQEYGRLNNNNDDGDKNKTKWNKFVYKLGWNDPDHSISVSNLSGFYDEEKAPPGNLPLVQWSATRGATTIALFLRTESCMKKKN